MTAKTTTRTAGYAPGAGEVERARLLAQGEIYRTQTESLFDRIGVGPGWRALDVDRSVSGVRGV